MREIKFRGKIAISSGWAYGHYALVKENGREYSVIYDNGRPLIVRIHTVSQYTGLKDKNGTEIYEKDILDFDNRRHVVTFDNGGFGIWKDVRVDLYSNQMRKLHEPLWNLVVDECEVIGNIYEHPHLLEESK